MILADNFDNSLGQFPNYDTFGDGDRAQLARQKHVDLRSFEPDPLILPFTMYSLDQDLIAAIDGLTMAELEAGQSVPPNEAWTAGTIGPQADRHNYLGISLTCAIGTNTAASVDLNTAIDISSFVTGDYISLACPALPLANLTAASTFLDISSDPAGTFAAAATDSLPFSASITTLVAGDCEVRFPLSLLTHVNRAAVTGLRFRIQATGSCTFRCLAIRAIASTWVYESFDLDTLYHRLKHPVPPTGSIAQTSVPAYHVLRSAPVPGPSDPRPIDIDLGVTVHTGSNSTNNGLTLYLRETPFIDATIGSLDGQTMSQLLALGQQPGQMGYQDDPNHVSRVTVALSWGNLNPQLAITGNDGQQLLVTGSTPLSPATDYYLHTELSGTSVRARLYNVSVTGVIDYSAVLLDSTAMISSSFAPRRPGRVGWLTMFGDGDTYVKNFRPRSVVYAEYQSLGLRSQTPVDAVRIYPSCTPDLELFTLEAPNNVNGASVTPDATKSASGDCYRIDTAGLTSLEGLTSTPLLFEDFNHSTIEFDVLFPLPSTRLIALLAAPGVLIELGLPPIATNTWQHISLSLDTVAQFQPGIYELLIIQEDTVQSTWYIDNLALRMRVIDWAARGRAGDAWGMDEPSWTSLLTTPNTPRNGAVVGRGRDLQVRGRAIALGGEIESIQILPKYAELGNFIWSDQSPVYGAQPTAHFGLSASGLTITADGRASGAANGILNYLWTFGDGTFAYGPVVSHTYPTGGTYLVTLTAIDRLGLKSSASSMSTSVTSGHATLPLVITR